MNHHLAFVSSALFAAAALAQSSASTATNFAVLANNGTSTGFDSRAQGTAVGRGIAVRALAGGATGTHPDAFAVATVAPFAMAPAGHGVQIHEEGGAHGASAGATVAAGTSADAPGTTNPTQGAHGIAVTYAVASGASGTVTIVWEARQSTGASIAGAVDVNGDGIPDWTGTGAQNARQTIAVTAGANGVQLAISTNGSAAVQGVGSAAYGASLTVLFRDGSGGGVTCTWTPSGPQCLGQLSGSDSRSSIGGLVLRLAISNAAANGIGVLLLGHAAASPIGLPTGTCQLLVDPASAHLAAFFTDGTGGAVLTLLTRAQPMSVDYQAVTFGFISGVLGSTNALNLTCQ